MKLWKLLKNNIPRTSALLHGSRMLKVGVIGAGRGVGTTHFALMASNYFANGLGYQTAVGECNGHGDFVKLYDETKNMDGDMRCFSYKGIDCCICQTTDELGQLYMKKYDVVIWAHHGMFCSGEDFDLTFGLLHTVEKSAEILVKILSMSPKKLQTITPDNFRHLAKDFHVTLPEEFLYEK